MKVLLVHACDRNYSLEGTEELGICSIAAFLREHGHEVLLQVVRQGCKDYSKIIDFKPQVVGFTTYSTNIGFILEICNILRSDLPDIKTVLGGCLPTYYWEDIIKENDIIDYVTIREGEVVWGNLLKYLEGKLDISKVNGLAFRDNGVLTRNPDQEFIKDLDILPMPARDILVDNNISFASISTSRGCYGYCNFCVTKDFWHRDWRGRSIKKVVDEIEFLARKHNICRFNISDASFEDPGDNFERPVEFAKEILERELKIAYYIEMRSEFYKKTDMSKLNLMKQSGLSGIYTGIETFNSFDRKLYGKIGTVEDNINVLTLLSGLNVAYYFGLINFNPYSTFENIRSNLKYLTHFGFAYDIYLLTHNYEMYRGTSIYDKVRKDNLLLDKDNPKNFGIYNNYRYVDARIGELFDFILKFFKDPALFTLAERLHFYGHEYMNYLYYLKRFLNENQNMKVLLKQHEEGIREVLSVINKHHAEWFGGILNIAENSWDIEYAYEFSNQYINREYLSQKTEMLEKMHTQMVYGVLKENRRYMKYLNI